MKNWTFAQWFAMGLALMSAIALLWIFFFVALHSQILKDAVVASFLTGIVGVFLYSFQKSTTFVLGSSASSQSKDEAILNSTPIVKN